MKNLQHPKLSFWEYEQVPNLRSKVEFKGANLFGVRILARFTGNSEFEGFHGLILLRAMDSQGERASLEWS